MRTLPHALVLVVLVAAAPAAAHVTTTVDPLQGPLVVGQPTNVTVHFSEPCLEVAPQQAQGQDTIQAGLDPSAPATFAWEGETVPFTLAECDPTTVPFALVRATATLTITASPDAPGLVNLTLPVTSYLGESAEPGDNVSLAVTVAHYANGTLTARPASGAHAGHEAGHGKAIELVLVYTTNAEALLTFEATSSTGVVHEIDATRVAPPSFTNRSTSDVEVLASFEPPAEWDAAELTFAAFLTPIVGGARLPVGAAMLTLENDGADAGHGDGHGADGHDGDAAHDDGKDAPAPAFALLALALVAFAARRR